MMKGRKFLYCFRSLIWFFSWESSKPRKSIKPQEENRSVEPVGHRESVRMQENIPSNRSNSFNKNSGKAVEKKY